MRTGKSALRRRELALLVAVALGLSACGGGGGSNTKPNIPPVEAPDPPPTPPTTPTIPTPPVDAQLSITNTYAAHDQGYSGAGVTIGVVDTGIMRNHPSLAGRVQKELIYVDSSNNDTSVDDVVGHGTWVSEIAAGTPFASFAGGIAPGAGLVSARIISDEEPVDDGSGQGNAVTADDAQFFAQTLNPALIDADVDVMNNSWGGIYWDTSKADINNAFAKAYEPFVLQHGGLVVFAAGNDGRDDPSDIAALPSLAPQLEKGWLVAVAVDSNNPSQLAEYSNACGKAMNYCLAAPGDVIVSDKDATTGNSDDYFIVQGTSFAAPEVSGAAALVWEAFPYFDNDLVRQTLLGTADDLGEPGPDKVFGYGELNVGNAVNGPAKFDWGDVTVKFEGQSVWSNAISGAGGLTKDGAGTLILTEPSTFEGLTNVLDGTFIAKSLTGSLNVDGLVRDTHDVGGNITNSGTLMVSGGDVNVGASYYQWPGGRLALELGSVLRVSGAAELSGPDNGYPGADLQVVGAADGYVANSHTDVIVAKGGLTGTFSTLSLGTGVMLSATLNYDATSAWLDVTQVQASAVPDMTYTVASKAAADRVDVAFSHINAQLASGGSAPTALMAGAASLQQASSTTQLQSSLESLSGQLHAASAAMTFEAIDAGTRALSDRFDTLLDDPKAGGWSQNLGYHGGMSRSGYNSVGYDLSGWLVGQDYKVGSRGFAGYALSQSRGLGRLAESADQGRSRAWEGMFYGGVIHGAWYTMGRFGVGSYREDMRRQLQLGNQLAGVTSDGSGSYGVAYGESGYRLSLGGTQIIPYTNLQYAQIRRDGFSEQGGYGFGLKSAADNAARWQAGVGIRATHEWSMARAGTLSLQARMLWQHAFGVRGDVFDASFTGLNQFAPVGGIGLSRYGGVAGTTLDWQMTPNASLQLGYDRFLAQHQQAQMGTLGFRWSF